MMHLQHQVPSVYEEFQNGNYAVQKSAHVFSTIAMDQAHEQMNGHIKGDSAVIWTKDNPSDLIRWITAWPDIARIIDEIKNSVEMCHTESTEHHDQGPSIQSKVAEHVKAMVATFQELGNSLIEDSKDLIVLDTKEVKEEDALIYLKAIKSEGQAQYEKYVIEMQEKQLVTISDIIPKNNISPFQKTSPSKQSNTIYKITTLKRHCEYLFGPEMVTWVIFSDMKIKVLHHLL